MPLTPPGRLADAIKRRVDEGLEVTMWDERMTTGGCWPPSGKWAARRAGAKQTSTRWLRRCCCSTISTPKGHGAVKKRAWALLAFAISCGKPDPDKLPVGRRPDHGHHSARVYLLPGARLARVAWRNQSPRLSVSTRECGGCPQLKSGVYTFDKDESWSSVVQHAESGRGLEVRSLSPKA